MPRLIHALAILALVGCDPTEQPEDLDSGVLLDAREVDADTRPDITGRDCDRSNPCPDYRYCCHAAAQQCVRGIRQGPGSNGDGGDFLDICYADVAAVPMPAFACFDDGFEGAPCDGPEDCHLPGGVDDGPGDGLCCAREIGECIRGIDRDTQGFQYPSCYARTDMPVPPELCVP